MSGSKSTIDSSPELLETIISTLNSKDEKYIIQQIIKCYTDYGLPVKIKLYEQKCMEGTFRILCFIKKSAEAVIINNKGMGHDGVSIQVRIDDRDVFNKLDNLSDNIKKQIINSKDCRYCSSKCENKKYTFNYKKNEYIKCHFICSNFSFINLNKNDINCFIGIIKNEIIYKLANKKK